MADIFNRGIPYRPDVNKLREAFPSPSLIWERDITYEEIETVISCKYRTSRYYGVVNAWIKRERHESGINLVWNPPKGIRVFRPDEMLSHVEKQTLQKSRQFGKAVAKFNWVDREHLDENGKKRLDHVMFTANRLKLDLLSGTKKLSIELAPIQSLPKKQLL